MLANVGLLFERVVLLRPEEMSETDGGASQQNTYLVLNANPIRLPNEPCSHLHLPPLVLLYVLGEFARLPFLPPQPKLFDTSVVDVLSYTKPLG